jgi:hypothetical protein
VQPLEIITVATRFDVNRVSIVCILPTIRDTIALVRLELDVLSVVNEFVINNIVIAVSSKTHSSSFHQIACHHALGVAIANIIVKLVVLIVPKLFWGIMFKVTGLEFEVGAVHFISVRSSQAERLLLWRCLRNEEVKLAKLAIVFLFKLANFPRFNVGNSK